MPFGEPVSVLLMRVFRGNPHSMGLRGLLPLAALPGIGIPIPFMVAADPHMLLAGTRSAMLHLNLRRANFYYSLSLSGADPDCERETTMTSIICALCFLGDLQCKCMAVNKMNVS
jgi:hypothetical protein